ncbi:hypothetical protein HMH09_002969 [Listeria monocytogenes]|nr:hypothetical protein [Listeria monocytogenes]MBC2339355.1 hypothetical protein [Listeria welshimeri]
MTNGTSYKVDNEIYTAIVLTKSRYIGSYLDDQAFINRYLSLSDLFKSISIENIEEYKVKDTDLETELYNKIRQVSKGTITLSWTIELAICAFNVNDRGIFASDLEHLLSERLIYSKTGLYAFQLELEIERYFGEEIITRERLDEFSEYILNNRRNKHESKINRRAI